jgi:hypothetical protein
MELQHFFGALLRRWYCIVVPVALVAVWAVPELVARPSGAPTYSVAIRYTAAQVLEAIPNRDGDFQDVWLASELTVNAFTDWVRGSRFEQAVRETAQRAGVDVPAGAFSVAAENEKSVGRITLTGNDEAVMRAVAEAAVQVLVAASSEVFPQLGGVAAQVELLDAPNVTGVPAPIASRLQPVIRLGLALAAGIALALLVDYADPYLRRRAQLEGAGVRVLSSVPRD